MSNTEKGMNWHKEVATAQKSDELYDKRAEFYKDRVNYKLGETFDDIVNDLTAKGYKTLDEHFDKNYSHEVTSDSRLFLIFKDYYESQFGLDASQAEKEAYLSLAHVMKAGGKGTNVDLLNIGERVAIDGGKLYIFEADGKTRSDGNGVPMRPQTEEENKNEAKVEEKEVEEELGENQQREVNEEKEIEEELGENQETEINETNEEELVEHDELKGFRGDVENISEDKVLILEKTKSPYNFNHPSSIPIEKTENGWIVDGNENLSFKNMRQAAELALAIVKTENIASTEPIESDAEKPFYTKLDGSKKSVSIFFNEKHVNDKEAQTYITQGEYADYDQEAIESYLNGYVWNRINKVKLSSRDKDGEEFAINSELVEDIGQNTSHLGGRTIEFSSNTEAELICPYKERIKLSLENGKWLIQGDESLSYDNISEAIMDARVIQDGLAIMAENPTDKESEVFSYTIYGNLKMKTEEGPDIVLETPYTIIKKTEIRKHLDKVLAERRKD